MVPVFLLQRARAGQASTRSELGARSTTTGTPAPFYDLSAGTCCATIASFGIVDLRSALYMALSRHFA